MRLYFNFSPQLMLAVGLLYLVLEDHLQSNYVLAALFSRQVHITEFTFAKWLADFKIVKAPFFCSFLGILYTGGTSILFVFT
jgi:hypothetical protein